MSVKKVSSLKNNGSHQVLTTKKEFQKNVQSNSRDTLKSGISESTVNQATTDQSIFQNPDVGLTQAAESKPKSTSKKSSAKHDLSKQKDSDNLQTKKSFKLVNIDTFEDKPKASYTSQINQQKELNEYLQGPTKKLKNKSSKKNTDKLILPSEQPQIEKQVEKPLKKEAKKAVKNEIEPENAPKVESEKIKIESEKAVKKNSEKPSKKETEKPLKKESEKPSKKETEKLLRKESEKPSKKESEKSSKKKSENPSKKESEKPSKKEFEKPSKKESEKPSKKESEKPSKKASEKPSKKESEKPSQKESEKPAKKVSEKPLKKETEKPLKKETEKPAKKESKESLNKKTELSRKGKSEKPAKKEFENLLNKEIKEAGEAESKLKEAPQQKREKKNAEKLSKEKDIETTSKEKAAEKSLKKRPKNIENVVETEKLLDKNSADLQNPLKKKDQDKNMTEESTTCLGKNKKSKVEAAIKKKEGSEMMPMESQLECQQQLAQQTIRLTRASSKVNNGVKENEGENGSMNEGSETSGNRSWTNPRVTAKTLPKVTEDSTVELKGKDASKNEVQTPKMTKAASYCASERLSRLGDEKKLNPIKLKINENNEYALKAAEDFKRKRGKDFKKEMQKKKKSSWKGCGGAASSDQINSIKFDSD